jgi:peptidoglycan/LPS O-acetylase OafA/YrhL
MSDIQHANSFDFVRLAGSLLVLYSHGYAVAGAPEPTIGAFCSLGSLGVFIFFAISGYLVTMSWLSDANIVRFAMRRSLRIFPALTVVILISTFALGPVVTTLPAYVYFQHPATYQYLANIGLYVHYYLPGCYEHVPMANAVNGSLWSLPPEVLMYLVLGALGCASLVRRRLFMASFGGALGLAALYLLRSTPTPIPLFHWVVEPHPAPILFLGMELHQVFLVAPYFWAGCLFGLYRERIKLTMNTTIIVFMVMALLPAGNLLWLWSWFAIPYIVLAFCTQNDRLFSIPAWIGDLSYGIYIYAFPIQQTIYFYWHTKLSLLEMMAITAALTLLCAFISWHIIEKPALRLKPRRRKAATGSAPEGSHRFSVST